MNQQFDIRRLGYLGRSYLIHNWRGLAVAAGAGSGVIFIIVFLEALFTRRVDMDYSSALTAIMVIWGCINASMAFGALHNKNANDAYLLLPASALEKTLVKLLFASVVLPAGIILMVSLTSVISEGVTGLLFGTGFQPMVPFLADHMKTWLYVAIAQSVFFLGSAWFRKAHFIKTVLTVAIGAIGLGFIGGFLFRIIFASYFEGFFTPMGYSIDMEALVMDVYPNLVRFLEIAGQVVFYGLLAPFCWFVAWLRVKETQSSDGV